MPVPDPDSLFPSPLVWTRRRWLAATLALVATSACASVTTAAQPRVLFVCEAGTVKSAMARELFRARAAERGISVDVFSRGINPADHVSPGLRERLAEDHIDTTAEAAQALTPADWRSALLVVAFNPLPASVDRSDVIDWTSVGSMNDDYDRSLADLNARIERLLDALEARGLTE